MHFIGILGLLTLLGVAWAISYHRGNVSWRIVAWGLGLQFLFALIILREDVWSFVGMAILALLVVAYILKGTGASVPWIGAGLAATLAVAFGASQLPAAALLVALVVLVVLLIVRAQLAVAPKLAPYGGALLLAVGLALLMARGVHGRALFASLSEGVAAFLNLADYGSKFLFSNLADPQYFEPGAGGTWPGFGFQFAFKVLPTIIFFGGVMAILYYLGIIQKVVEAMSRFLRWTIGTSGAETLSCSANIFVGQTEAPLLIKPFLARMTKSELLTIMVGGFATIAGGVLAAYIAMGVPAAHLLAASVMSAPAALVVGKIIYPETEHSETAGDVKMPTIQRSGNVIEAAATGITDGLKLAVNVGAMLLGFIALIAVLDAGLNWCDRLIDGTWLGGEYVAYHAVGLSPAVGEYVGYFPGSLQTIFGTVLRPLAWLMGVPWAEAGLVGNLLGIKLSLNELVAYSTLGNYIHNGTLGERGVIIATYALCGFANVSSIGIQIGGISALAPERRGDLAKVGLKAMFGGAIASWTTATIAGLLIA